MPNVLILIGDTKISGPVKGVLQLVQLLNSRPGKYKLVNCVTDKAETSEIVEGAKEKGCSMQQIVHAPRNYWFLFKQIKKLVQTNKANIVQTHGYKQSFIGLLLKYFVGIKWVCFLHGTTSENVKAKIYHSLDNVMQRFADRTVLVTEQQRKKLIGGYNFKRVRVISNAIDISNTCKWHTHQLEARTELGLDWFNNVVFAVVGRLSPEKGVDVFLEAFSIAQKSNSTIRAIIVGDGPERDNLTEQCTKLGLCDDLIKFTGYSPRPFVYMSAADCIVLPSRSEGIPNVALEAMAMQRLVIATAVGGVPEIIIPLESGLLVPAENPSDLAKAMLTVVESKDLVDKIAKKGRDRVEYFYRPVIRADSVSMLYQELLK